MLKCNLIYKRLNRLHGSNWFKNNKSPLFNRGLAIILLCTAFREWQYISICQFVTRNWGRNASYGYSHQITKIQVYFFRIKSRTRNTVAIDTIIITCQLTNPMTYKINPELMELMTSILLLVFSIAYCFTKKRYSNVVDTFAVDSVFKLRSLKIFK